MYTKEELEAMDIPQLVGIADQLGIKVKPEDEMTDVVYAILDKAAENSAVADDSPKRKRTRIAKKDTSKVYTVNGDEGENLEDDEDFADLEDDAGELEPEAPQRQVIIKSSQGEIVTAGDRITLSSELRGFGDDEQVTYQWQVDRGEGNGWEDVEGATKDKHVFIADRTTIRYSWRLIVNVIEE